MAGELITGDGQLEFNGYLLGDNEVTFLDAINGWDDLPAIDSGNAPKPSSHGSWVGPKLAQERIITWEGRFAAEPEEWADKLKNLRKVFNIPIGEREDPIVIRMHDDAQMSYGAVTARAIPGDRSYGYYGANLSLQFTCSDPRRYSLVENSRTLFMPDVVSNGLVYPLTYPLNYGVESGSSSGLLFNDGDITAPTVITFYGPMNLPGLVNTTMGTRLQFDISLTETDVLTVDTRLGTVLLNGVDRLYTRTVNSSPILSFGLLPGANDIQLTASFWYPPARATISWRNAGL